MLETKLNGSATAADAIQHADTAWQTLVRMHRACMTCTVPCKVRR